MGESDTQKSKPPGPIIMMGGGGGIRKTQKSSQINKTMKPISPSD